jgi:hypothetical protein
MGEESFTPFRVYLDRALIFRLFLFSLPRKKLRLVTASMKGFAARKLNTTRLVRTYRYLGNFNDRQRIKAIFTTIFKARPGLSKSVADHGCSSRILIFIYPRSNKSTKREEEKKFFCPTIFCRHKHHKIVNNFIFEHVKKIFYSKTL